VFRKRVPGVGSGDRKSLAADGSPSDWRHDQTVSSCRTQRSSTRDINSRTESTTKSGKTEKKLRKVKMVMLRSIGKQSVESVESVLEKRRKPAVGRICTKKEGFKPGMKE